MTIKTEGKVPTSIKEDVIRILRKGEGILNWRKLSGVSCCYTAKLRSGYRIISDKVNICLICKHDNYERYLNRIRKFGGLLWN